MLQMFITFVLTESILSGHRSKHCFTVVNTVKMLHVPCYQHSSITSWVYYLDRRQCSWRVHVFRYNICPCHFAVESETSTSYKLLVNLYKEGTIIKTCIYSRGAEKGESLSHCPQFLYNTTGLNYLYLQKNLILPFNKAVVIQRRISLSSLFSLTMSEKENNESS